MDRLPGEQLHGSVGPRDLDVAGEAERRLGPGVRPTGPHLDAARGLCEQRLVKLLDQLRPDADVGSCRRDGDRQGDRDRGDDGQANAQAQ